MRKMKEEQGNVLESMNDHDRTDNDAGPSRQRYTAEEHRALARKFKRKRVLTAWKEKDIFASEMQSLRANLLS